MFELCVYVLTLSAVSDSLPPPWTVAYQAPLSTRILPARILEWVAMPPPGDLPNPGIKQGSPALQADSLPTELPGKLASLYIGVYIYTYMCIYILLSSFKEKENIMICLVKSGGYEINIFAFFLLN